MFPGANVRAHTTEGCTVRENPSQARVKTGTAFGVGAELGRAVKMLGSGEVTGLF